MTTYANPIKLAICAVTAILLTWAAYRSFIDNPIAAERRQVYDCIESADSVDAYVPLYKSKLVSSIRDPSALKKIKESMRLSWGESFPMERASGGASIELEFERKGTLILAANVTSDGVVTSRPESSGRVEKYRCKFDQKRFQAIITSTGIDFEALRDVPAITEEDENAEVDGDARKVQKGFGIGP